MNRQTISIDELRSRLKAQGVSDRTNYAFKCPMCETVQSIKSFICAGISPEEASDLIGFSCVGRVLGAGGPRSKPDGKPCNWTLGGFFRLHTLEIVDEQGTAHAHFALASPEEAQALQAANAEAGK